jgi:hypothetical protein
LDWLALNSELRQVVPGELELDRGPRRIAAWLQTDYPDRPTWWICHDQ